MSALSFPLRGNPRAEELSHRFSQGERYPHALLIEGPPGSGKSTFARYLAMGLLCRAGKDRPCGVCSSCRKVERSGHPDLLVYESEKKTSRSFHVDLVREARAQAFVRPNENEKKILLLEDCETMTEQAQNALLKVLEEPPASAIFLLTCRNRAELLETIRSRAACVSLETPGVAACAEVLAQRFPDCAEEAVKHAAAGSLGSVGLAVKMLEGGGGGDAGYRETAAQLLERVAAGDEYGALRLLIPYERDRPGLTQFLEALRIAVSRRMLEGGYGGGAKINRLQLFRIAGIIEDVQEAVRFNVGGLILGASLVARCIQAVGDPVLS